MPADVEVMNLITDAHQIVRHLRTHGGWVVVLCPNRITATSCAKALMAFAPTGSSGRTSLFPFGRVSVATPEDSPFVPDGVPFVLTFFNWQAKDNSEKATRWQTKASGFLRA